MSSPPLDLGSRCRLPELMDQPGLDPREHERALHGLARLNRLSGAAAQYLREIEPLARERPVRVLDLACGGGDVAIELQLLARRRGLPVEVSGCDFSETALERARAASEAAGAGLRFFSWDLDTDGIPEGHDVTCCSLFLHHLDEEQGLRLLRGMAEASELLVVQDLRRSALGYGLAWFASRFLTRSPVVREDALLSVRAAHGLDEAAALARRAGLEGARVRAHWPQRFSLSWRRPS